jgi:hypothetical protein
VNQLVDEIKRVEVKLYFPLDLVLSEKQYDETFYKTLLCTVEISHYGARGPNAELKAKGLVRGMRIITIQDQATQEWFTFKPTNRKILGLFQKALCDEVIAKLELSPPRPKPATVVPRDIVLG